MKTIHEQLTTEFANFKIQYLTKVELWSKEQKQKADELNNWYDSIRTQVVQPKKIYTRETMTLAGKTFNYTNCTLDFSDMSKEQKELYDLVRDRMEAIQKTYQISLMSLEKYVAKQLEAQSKWFDASVLKLAVKVEAKDLNLENLQITSTYVDQNLCTIITDGIKKVKAQTIFANGCIKAPHFRYLIK
jgi:hypothetical protein